MIFPLVLFLIIIFYLMLCSSEKLLIVMFPNLPVVILPSFNFYKLIAEVVIFEMSYWELSICFMHCDINRQCYCCFAIEIQSFIISLCVNGRSGVVLTLPFRNYSSIFTLNFIDWFIILRGVIQWELEMKD